MAISPNVKIKDLDLTSNPNQIKFFNFVELIGKRPDIPDWDATIHRLVALHERYYKLLEYTDPIPNVGDFSPYFIEAANWLTQNTPTSMLAGIPAAGATESITVELLNQFRDSYVGGLEGQLSQQPFQIAEQVYLRISDAIEKLGTIKADKHLEKVIKTSEERFVLLETSYKESLLATVNQAKQEAVAEITTASSLADWVKYYGRVEAEYTVLIEGSSRIKLRNPITKIKTDNKSSYSFFWPIYVELNSSLEESMIKSYKFGEARKRLFWFLILGTVVLIPVVLSFIDQPTVLGLKNIFYINTAQNPLDYKLIALEKLRYLPMLVFASIGYAFSNKNFRILSNLREQYRHRKTVSTTLQGIITAIDENQNNTDIRIKLVEIGAKAMFELKTIGHLTKRDSESSPMAEIVQTIKS